MKPQPAFRVNHAARTWLVIGVLLQIAFGFDILVDRLIGDTSNPVARTEINPDFHYIDTSFENASPIWYELDDQGRVLVHLTYDLERDSPNRANGHWHFKLQATKGSRHTIVLNNLNNVWNGKPGVPVSNRTICKVSENGKDWRTIETYIENDDQLVFEVEMLESHLFIAHVEPYRISDLEALKR
ncbi:MAG: hypothetical protein O2964_13515, partial [Verrucomicrobia bacterium]|nr:hypothetical protein [Verrucomicrobiota bacterium]